MEVLLFTLLSIDGLKFPFKKGYFELFHDLTSFFEKLFKLKKKKKKKQYYYFFSNNVESVQRFMR